MKEDKIGLGRLTLLDLVDSYMKTRKANSVWPTTEKLVTRSLKKLLIWQNPVARTTPHQLLLYSL